MTRSEPFAGTLFHMPSQGADDSLRMLLDLDEPRAVVREVAKDSSPVELKPGDPYFDTHTISLKDGEQQVIVLRIRTQKAFFSFLLKVTYQIGGETKSMVIDDGGKPFAITAFHYGGSGVLSYEQAFELQGDFSLCEIANPSRIIWEYISC